MKKILFVFGTRPEAIKMAPVIDICKKNEKNFNTYVAVTAQHREMLDQVLDLFNIIPDFDLDLMSANQSLESLTGKILDGISNIIKNIKPDLIFVQGDTTTTLAASLAGFYNKVPIAHIEAGLRTNNKYSPFPEEVNRKITSVIATYHFPPTENSKKNLISEGINNKNIEITGNTVIDALLFISKKIDKKVSYYEKIFNENYNINFTERKIILVTGHRRESFGLGFENICNAIKHVAENNDVQFIYPIHLNPNVQEPVKKILSNIDNIALIPPQDYAPFIFLMKKSHIILTDSGGVQEEAPTLGKPVIIMRDTTERNEGIDFGSAILSGTDVNNIISSIELLLNNKEKYDKMAKATNPFGLGLAAEKIYDKILSSL